MANLTWASASALILTLLALIVCVVSMATDHWADVTMFENAFTALGRTMKVTLRFYLF